VADKTMSFDPLAIRAWEIGAQELSPPERALRLLGLLYPDQPEARLAQWSIGKRNIALLKERLRILGPQITAVSSCPSCSTAIEAELDGRIILDTSHRSLEEAEHADPGAEGSISVTAEGWSLTLRPPNSADLIDLVNASYRLESPAAIGLDPMSAPVVQADDVASRLLRQCLINETAPQGTLTGSVRWPDAVVTAAEAAMSAADPLAEILLSLSCADCGHDWEVDFDIAEFFLAELQGRAERVLDDVHILASQYGWAEGVIVALTPARRAAYIARLRTRLTD